ncbi:MAG: Carbonate dehydratase [Polaromonas sp.]|nr:Carbonate dehydratase [Polaromonas sp.]
MSKIKSGLIALVLQTAASLACANAEWSYTDSTGPAYWGSLSPDYATCSSGQSQSPINIKTSYLSTGATLPTSYTKTAKEIFNSGHTIQVNFNPGNTLTIEGVPYELKQVHFHAASEHNISGVSYPLEAHFVHADSQGKLAVVGVMFVTGTANAALQNLWNQIPATEGSPVPLTSTVYPYQLMPSNKEHYRYSGSLTTPPCSEGVRWHVMRYSLTASGAQIDAFKNVIHDHANNRPLQPLNGRSILKGLFQSQ